MMVAIVVVVVVVMVILVVVVVVVATMLSTLSSLNVTSPAREKLNRIPQFNGNIDHHQGFLQTFECNNCGAFFDEKEELKLHNDLSHFGCDDDECGKQVIEPKEHDVL